MNTPNIWFTSDHHFNHANIIDYCDRPFQSVEIMNETMIKRWNEVVKKNDKVYHLGDFGLGSKEQITSIVSQLNGDIYLIKGNHCTHPNQWYRDCGFKEVYDHPIILYDFLVLSHEPQPFIPNQMLVNLFGHVHTSLMFQTWGKQSACLCVERHNYYPVSLDTIKEQFAKGNN